MKRTTITITLLSILLLSTACNINDFNGSDTMITVEKTLPYFNKISVNDIAEVHVVKGNTQTVRVTVNDNLLEQVVASVNDQVLTIGLKKGSYQDVSLKVEIQLPELLTVATHDATEAYVESTNRALTIKGYAASEIHLTGMSDSLNVSIHHSSSIHGYSFTTDHLQVYARDAANMEITVESDIKGTVRESAIIRYKGNPRVQVTTKESGKVERVN